MTREERLADLILVYFTKEELHPEEEKETQDEMLALAREIELRPALCIHDERWVKDYVALLKPKAVGKSDAELDAFAREMLMLAQERGRVASKIKDEPNTTGHGSDGEGQ